MACALWIARDCRRHPQHMGIMNLVWPLSALFGSLLLLWFYLRHGRATGGHDTHETEFHIAVAKGALHCGSGCTLGDILAETIAATSPSVLALFGWPGLFGDPVFAVWSLDFVFAFGFGILFQFFTIAPARGLGLRDGLVAALKADTLSLMAWQVGMYGAMGVALFVLFPPILGTRPDASSPVFWWAMQVAMIAGLVTSYPMNWWLIHVGLKERM
jgi:Domain of unknown function (DUF4396)